MFICLFVCLFVYRFDCIFVLILVVHQQIVPLEILWRFVLIWLRYLGSKKNVYLFVCVLTCFFYFNNLGTPKEIYPKNFVKIRFDLAEIFRI